MTEAEFAELIRETGLSAVSREAARLVFVEEMQQVAAAAEVGISKQRMNQIVKVVRQADERRMEEAELARLRQGVARPAVSESVAALEASYAIAVKSAREQHGDDAHIQAPGPNVKTVGEVISRTDFHLVQSTGRGSVVIHELAKLDRVPPVGRSVAITYSDGRGVVADRGHEVNRGSISR
ncbi:KfrB domain-containing protein [Paraburkholderia humisilvae]|uniref:KfrB domain-containing protein n=1 Tax=Paraburkholderia humisilvae TaxID=627669 RepID=UPI00158192C3|nr:TrfB-related DNA-binding protein [Paraburkholderia humisilvae]